MSRQTPRRGRLAVGTDTLVTTVLQGAGAVAAFALNLIIVRELSKFDYGYFTLTQAILTIASGIADFGIAALVMPRMSIAGGDATPWFKAGIVLRAMSILVAWLAVNAYLLARGDAALAVYVNIGFLTMLITARMIGFRQFLELVWRLEGRTYMIPTVAIADTLLLLVVIIALAANGSLTMITVMLAMLFTSIPGFVVLGVLLWRTGRIQRYFREPLTRRIVRAISLASLPVAAMVVLGQVFGQLEVFVIDAYLPTTQVAAYGASVRPIAGLLFIATAISFGIAPLVSQVHKGGRRDVSLNFVASLLVRIMALVSLLICLAAFLFARQVMEFYGPAYVEEAYIFRYYSVISGLTFLVIVGDMLLLFTGRRSKVLSGAMIAVSVAMTLNLLLIGPMGVPGVMLAKVAAQVALIAWQLRSSLPAVRSGMINGLTRAVVPAAALAAALAVTADWQLWPRAALTAAALAVAVLGSRLIRISELQTMRKIRLT